MALNLLGLVQLLQILFLLFSQDLASGANGLVDALNIRESDNGTGDALVDPGEGDVAHAPASALSNLDHSIDNGQIGLDGAVGVWVCVLLQSTSVRGAKVGRRSSQVASTERCPGNQSHARVVTEADHLSLLLTVEEVIVILHRDEFGPCEFFVLVGE